MDLRQIAAFVAVTDTGSFSKAAAQLFVTQPTISSHIKLLEEELGVELLRRSTRNLELTEPGKEFYQSAKSIVKIIESIPDSLSKPSLNELKIGSSSAPMSKLLPEVIAQFYQEHPTVEFMLDKLDTQQIIEGVLDGTYHLGVVGNTVLNNQLIFDKLESDRIVLITPNTKKYKTLLGNPSPNLTDLLKEPLILREEGSGTRKEALRLIESAGFDINNLHVVAHVNDISVQKELVRSGLGISFASKMTVQQEIDSQQVLSYEISPSSAVRHFYLVYRNSIVFPELIQSFITHLKNKCQCKR